MGQYKVPQDVEAEDKIIGPLTLKQFLYAVGGVGWGAASWALFHAVWPLLLLVGIPPTLLLLMLGLYRRQDQPFETYFVSLVGFVGRPRQRIWQKDEALEGLRVEPPKQVAAEQTQRNPGEVRSQLEQLTQVMDTRGWSAKEAAVQEPVNTLELDTADRLFLPESQPSPDVITEVKPTDDVLDMEQNPAARTLGVLIQNHAKAIRDEALAKMRVPVAKSPAIHDIKSDNPMSHSGHKVVAPPPQGSSQIGNRQSGDQSSPSSDLRAGNPSQASTSEMTANPFNAILKLAMEESGLKVSQIAAQANRQASIPEGQSVNVRNAAQQSSPSPTPAIGQ